MHRPDLNMMGFPGCSAGKESACNAGDLSSIPRSGCSPGEGLGYPFQYSWASLEAQMVKNPPALWKTGFNLWVVKIHWRRAWQPLQYSCLENPMDRGAWWAAVHWVTRIGHGWRTMHSSFPCRFTTPFVFKWPPYVPASGRRNQLLTKYKSKPRRKNLWLKKKTKTKTI